MPTNFAWPRCKMPCLPVLLILAGANAFAAAPDHDWLPVTDAEIQMKSPVVDKTAGVEALFTRVHIVDDCTGGFERTSIHYVRLKVFNQVGKEKAAIFDIPFGGKASVSDIAGRTIQSNGTIIELSKDAIHERVMIKLSGVKIKAKSFAMPGVDVGSIIEYRWKETHEGAAIGYTRLLFQGEFPVQRSTYFIRPALLYCASGRLSMRWFNCQATQMEPDKDGYSSVTLENVPAFREEPLMPSEANVRPWVLVYYDHGEKRYDPDQYWNDVGKRAYWTLKGNLKASGELQQAATRAVAGAKDDNEKAILLIRWIRANIRDLWGRHVTDDERKALIKKAPRNRGRTAEEIVKSGIGNSGEMNELFAALALAVGLDARPALVANRNDMVFDKRVVESGFLDSVEMAVSIGGKWKIYDVGTRLLPAGMLSWTEEGVAALITDSTKPEFVTVPTASPADSLAKRTATLKLAEDGAIEGDVSQTWTGHAAERLRRDLDGESAERQQDGFKEAIMKRFPAAEVTALRLWNVDGGEQPLELSYYIRVPNYASRTGKRILFQPLFFAHGDTPLFTAAERHYEVTLPFPWQDSDSVTIHIPDGFQLENADRPGELGFGKPGSYKLSISARKGDLVCTRELTFGDNGMIAFVRDAYPKLKNIFDEVHRRDETTLSLKQVATPGGTE